MSKYKVFAGFAAALLILVIVAGCGKKNEDTRTKLTLWGIGTGEGLTGFNAALKKFERLNPDIRVVTLNMGSERQANQKLLTSIVGKFPPDVIWQNSYQVNDWASRDAFRPLNDFIERDRDKPFGIRVEDIDKNALDQVSMNGKIYAIPNRTDDVCLYYNKSLFRQAGLDPERPPKTWEEMKEYSKKLTLYNPDGSYKRVGYIPLQGNGSFCIFAWENGGEFFTKDYRKCTMTEPRIVEALEYVKSFYVADKGAKALSSFQSSFQKDAMDPFIMGQIAMTTNTPILLSYISQYAPDMDFGVAPVPVPKARYEGKPPFTGMSQLCTTAGGFSYAIPNGAKHEEAAWRFIKWISSLDAWRCQYTSQREYNLSKGRTFIPRGSANTKITPVLFSEFSPPNPNIRAALKVFNDTLPTAVYLPPSFITTRWYIEQGEAASDAIFDVRTPKEALEFHQQIVQREIDRVFEGEKYHVLDWKYPIAIICALVLGLAVFMFVHFRRLGPVGRLSKEETRAGITFVSPWLLGFMVFTAGPILVSIVFSFCDYDVLHPARWVGLLNYKYLLGQDWPIFSKCLTNVAYLSVFQLPLTLLLSLSVAMLLNTKVTGMTWYRTIYYLPSIVPGVASAILWIWVLNPQYGLINAGWTATLTQWFHIAAPKWLAAPETAKPALIVMGLWGAGGGMILWLAGLQGVPQQLYEAAEIDGAGWWGKLRAVTLPMLSPYIFFNLIMGVIHVLQQFETIYIMTNGGPANNATLVPVLYLFRNAFMYFKMGYASALAWLLFIVILTITITQIKLAPRWVHYEAEKR